MTSSLEINGKELLCIRLAAERTGYSRDYITRLAREQKIVASQIERQWFVDQVSLEHYANLMSLEQKVRQQKLSEERKRERVVREVPKELVRQKRRSDSHSSLKAKVVTMGVLMTGLGIGFALNQLPGISPAAPAQVASAPLLTQTGVSKKEGELVGTEEVVSGVNFSQESVGLATLEGADQGILLLPQMESGLADPTQLFSDEVKILTDAEGVQFVARVNEKGEVVEKIPFVVVPVNKEKRP